LGVGVEDGGIEWDRGVERIHFRPRSKIIHDKFRAGGKLHGKMRARRSHVSTREFDSREI